MITTAVMMQTSYGTGDQTDQVSRRFIYLLADSSSFAWDVIPSLLSGYAETETPKVRTQTLRN